MARKPEIFIRDLDFDESQRLTRIARDAGLFHFDGMTKPSGPIHQ